MYSIMAKYILKHQVGAECHAVAMALQQPNSTAWKPIHPGALGDPPTSTFGWFPDSAYLTGTGNPSIGKSEMR